MADRLKFILKATLAFLLGLLAFLLIYTEGASLFTLIGLSYSLGSIPFGYILSKLLLSQDIRQIGSGNIGATNVLRTGNRALAALTLVLDALKGAVAVAWLSQYSSIDSIPYILGIAAMLGHLYPIWLDFKGGKGVATGLGILLVISWLLAAVALLIWLGTALLTRYSSLAALVATAALPIIALVLGDAKLFLFALLLATLISLRHIDNIKRLIAGKELKIGQRPK